MTKEDLLNKYTDRKNNYYQAYNKLSDSTKKYISTAHLLMADVFSDLLEDLKNLPNEPKTIRDNKKQKKDCFNCISKKLPAYYYPCRECKDCNLWQAI